MVAVSAKTPPPRAVSSRGLLDPRASAAERDAALGDLLDETHDVLIDPASDRSQTSRAIEALFVGLYRLKLNSPPDEWQSLVQQCRVHRVCELIHEDPFTGRAFSKPRGYAGDAELLELIYGPEDGKPEPDVSNIGKHIYRFTSAAPAAEGVRARRAFIADLLDRSTAESPGMHVLAIAAGHLREASLASCVRRKRIGRFVALDADPLSLEEVNRCYGNYGVETVNASIRPLITNKLH